MADPWSEFTPQSAQEVRPDPWADFAPSTGGDKVNVAEDVVKSGGAGLVKGTAGMAGFTGDVRGAGPAAAHALGVELPSDQAVEASANWLTEKTGLNPKISRVIARHAYDLNPSPTTDDYVSAVETMIGPLHKPQTEWGKAAETVGEFLPGVVGGEGSWIRRLLTTVAAPAVGSEGAGYLAKGTAAEPVARAGGALVAGVLAPGSLRRGAPAAAAAKPSSEIAAADAQKLSDEFGIKYSSGQATQDLDKIRYEDMAARGAYGQPAQERASGFFDQQFQDIQDAGKQVGTTAARGGTVVENPAQAAEVVNADLSGRAETARTSRQAAETAAEREAQATRDIHADQGRALGDTITGQSLPIESIPEAGEVVGTEVRSAAAQARAHAQGLYDEAFSLPGQFHASAFEGVGNRVQGALTHGDNPVIIDDVTTPIASRAIRDLDNVSNLRIQNRADPSGQPNPENIVAVDLRGVDQARKRLVAYYQSARQSGNLSDARASGRLIDEFDNQVETAISNGLFSGDQRALQALQEARGAYRQYAQTFRPQGAGDDVGTALRRIIDRNATPEETANLIVGTGRIGNAGLPVRLAGRLRNILGEDSDAWSTVRQAIWRRASQAGTAGAENSQRTAQGIENLANSTLGRTVFSPQELDAMRTHARGIRDLEASIARLPARQTAERAQTEYERVFGGNEIGGTQAATFRRIIAGTATPEETSKAVFDAIGAGNPGNVSRLIRGIEGIVGPQSETMSAVRQGVWQKLTQHPVGKDQPGAQKIVQSIGEFLNGKGKTVAEQLFSEDERALMRRYANAVRKTIIPKYARTNSDTAPALLSAMHRAGNAVAVALGSGLEVALGGGLTGGLTGAAAGHGVSNLIGKFTGAAKDRRAAGKVADSLNWDLASELKPEGTRESRPGGLGAIVAEALTSQGQKLPPALRADDTNSPQIGTGERSNPVQLETPRDLHHGAERTELPSPAQAEAGNYRKRHLAWKGLDIAIETEAGQERTGTGADGRPWSTAMTSPYGYIKGTVGRDGDPVDVYVGPHPHSQHTFVFDQVDPKTGQFDEHKLVIGARDLAEAQSIYDSGFSDNSGPQRRGSATELSIPQLKQWLAKGDLDKPLSPDRDQVAGNEQSGSAGNTPTLEELFADKRSAKEIKADMMRRKTSQTA